MMGRCGRGAAIAVGVAALAFGATGCSGSSDAAKTVLVPAGQLPPATRPQVNTHGKLDASSVNTVPLAKQTATTALFSAIGQFQSCLTGRGVTFIGIPSASNPNSPANAPAYITALKTCAAQSNILQALKGAQSAQQNLTPKQVKAENKTYLLWRKCMIARGWGIPAPKPNAKGLLFTFSPGGSGGTGSSGGEGGFKPPPGQNILNSPDLQACAQQAEEKSGT